VAEPHPLTVDPRHPLVERVRAIAMRFPDAVEGTSWGRPTFRTGEGKKIFAFVGATMEQPFTIVIKPDPLDAPALRQDPRFWSPPYWGPSGWLAIALDAPGTDWQELTELLDSSYRQVALKRQLQALDLDPVVR
jgi:predicted DNA-binding protein (MmcQ/YjbR family)